MPSTSVSQSVNEVTLALEPNCKINQSYISQFWRLLLSCWKNRVWLQNCRESQDLIWLSLCIEMASSENKTKLSTPSASQPIVHLTLKTRVDIDGRKGSGKPFLGSSHRTWPDCSSRNGKNYCPQFWLKGNKLAITKMCDLLFVLLQYPHFKSENWMCLHTFYRLEALCSLCALKGPIAWQVRAFYVLPSDVFFSYPW